LSKRGLEGEWHVSKKKKGGKKGEREAKIPLSSPTFDKVVLS
jgi:hypothetical protein